MNKNRFVRAVSLLTIALFLFSASLDATLDHLEKSPGQSQLAIYAPNGRQVALYHGNLSQLRVADITSRPARPGGLLHRLREQAVRVEYRWL